MLKIKIIILKKKKIFTNLSPNVESKTNTDKLFLTKKLKFNNRSFAKDRNTTNNIKFVLKTRGSIGESKMNLTNKNMNNYTTIKDLIAKNIPHPINTAHNEKEIYNPHAPHRGTWSGKPHDNHCQWRRKQQEAHDGQRRQPLLRRFGLGQQQLERRRRRLGGFLTY